MIVDKRFGDLHDIRDFLMISHSVRQIAQKDEVISDVLRIQYPFCKGQPNDTHTFSAFLALAFPLGIYRKSKHALLDFWQFPHETLLLGIGDCEDTSILLGSLARAQEKDYWVVIGGVYLDGELLGYHAWVHMNLGGEWFLVETTLDEAPGKWISLTSPMQKKIKYKDLTYEALIFFNHELVEQVGEFDMLKRKVSWDSRRLGRLKGAWG